MTIPENATRLHTQLAAMIDLEIAIAEKLEALAPLVPDYAGARALLAEFQALPGEHRGALEKRLAKIGGAASPEVSITVGFSIDGLTDQTYHGASTALQIVYTLFNQALIGYSVLEVHGTRFRDSMYLEGEEEGTSYHLAVQFIKDYTQAIQQIIRVLHDVLLWEFDRDGFECQCLCPACGMGICLCSITGRYFLDKALEEAGPYFEAAPIPVQRPKRNSPAEKAGLGRGMTITGLEDREFESQRDLQDVLWNAKSGDEIRLKIRRESGELDEVAVVKP